ncbi:hypothetical protein [Exiguobacterium sp. AB2]|uniref:hypothetical protein n=1 Tax=Exiguobacterium sp. AB2 TaxID=1484479 RepID=UPI0004A8E58F|nr:hypothetical protein [Exiguobacterium sp. AB2]KDN58464.1 hypothetical protein DI14_04835 [Exiguobacterium sp. AB2]
MAFEIEKGIDEAVERMVEKYDNWMNIVIYQKLQQIGRQLIDTYENSDGNSSRHELEERSRLYQIGQLLYGLEAEGKFNQTSDTVDNLKSLYDMGVRLKITSGEIEREFDALSKTFKLTHQVPTIEVQLVKDIAKL